MLLLLLGLVIFAAATSSSVSEGSTSTAYNPGVVTILGNNCLWGWNVSGSASIADYQFTVARVPVGCSFVPPNQIQCFTPAAGSYSSGTSIKALADCITESTETLTLTQFTGNCTVNIDVPQWTFSILDTTPNCDDSNDCTADSCIVNSGANTQTCNYTNIEGSCSDNNDCTADTCVNGICTSTLYPLSLDENNGIRIIDSSFLPDGCVNQAFNISLSGTATYFNDYLTVFSACQRDNVTFYQCSNSSLFSFYFRGRADCEIESCDVIVVSIICLDNSSTTSIRIDDKTPICTNPSACNQSSCTTVISRAFSFCVYSAVPNCCLSDANCTDNNTCTADTCVNNSCVSAPLPNIHNEGEILFLQGAVEPNCPNAFISLSGSATSGSDYSIRSVLSACTVTNSTFITCTNQFDFPVVFALAITLVLDCAHESCETIVLTLSPCIVGLPQQLITINDTTPTCTDPDICTTGACINGTCVSSPVPNCCLSDSDCDDNDTCTTDVCTQNQCSHTVLDCDDGFYCNGQEFCLDGACRPGTPPTCDDGHACTADSCTDDQCVNTLIADCCESDSQCNHTFSCVEVHCNMSSHRCEDCPRDNLCPPAPDVCTSAVCAPANPAANPTTGCVFCPRNCSVPNACYTPYCNVSAGGCGYTYQCQGGRTCNPDLGCQSSGCTFSQGYWKNADKNAAKFNFSNTSNVVPCNLSCAKLETECILLNNYSSANCTALRTTCEAVCSNLSFYWTQTYSTGSNTYRSCWTFARQYFALIMNIFASNASTTPEVVVAILSVQPTALWNITRCPNATIYNSAALTAAAKVLENYNIGVIGPGHCLSESACVYSYFTRNCSTPFAVNTSNAFITNSGACASFVNGSTTYYYRVTCFANGTLQYVSYSKSSCSGTIVSSPLLNQSSCTVLPGTGSALYGRFYCNGCPESLTSGVVQLTPPPPSTAPAAPPVAPPPSTSRSFDIVVVVMGGSAFAFLLIGAVLVWLKQ
jgi:hypothetical protein